MTTALLRQIAEELESDVGATTSANLGETGWWKRIAHALENAAGLTFSGSYQARAALAAEVIAGASSTANSSETGYLHRIVLALEDYNNVTNTGSLLERFRLASVDYAGGGEPTNNIPPSISGSAGVGELLTADTGEWTRSPTSYAYQWYSNAVAIGGATNSTYTLTVSEEGDSITVGVIATNATGSSDEALSAAVGPVAAADTTPDAFSFTDAPDSAMSSTITSNSIVVSGIGAASAITITGGEYEKNASGSWTSGAGTVVNGDAVRVRHTSASTPTTVTNTVLTIGGVSDTFTSTTVPLPDTVPDAFSFTDITDAALSTQYTSNTIVIAGLGSGVSSPITITGGTYSKNGGAYTASAGTVLNGDTIAVRHTSSASNETATNTVVDIGGVSDTYTTTTLAGAGTLDEDITPPVMSLATGATTFPPQFNFDLDLTIQSGDDLVLEQYSDVRMTTLVDSYEVTITDLG